MNDTPGYVKNLKKESVVQSVINCLTDAMRNKELKPGDLSLIHILFCLLIVIFGIQMVISQYRLGQETATMQWPEWIYGSFVPVGAAFAMMAFLQTMVQMYKEFKAEEDK